MSGRNSPLSVDNVHNVFLSCLAEGSASHPTVTVQGIMATAHFAIAELELCKADIAGMLAQLPPPFQPVKSGGGGGWSFLNACNDKDNNLWTGDHRTMDMLFMLGIATGQAAWCMPRDDWLVLPGGMPYVAVVMPDE